MEENFSLSNELGRYVETVLRQWQLIAGAVLICAIAAGLVSLTLPKSYRARVLIASTRTTSDVSFGSPIETLSEEQVLASGGILRLVDPRARLQSYVQLVKNPAVAQQVLDELGDRLLEGERNIAALLDMVSGEVIAGSDSIEIRLAYHDPVVATELANAWGRAYEVHVNNVYGTMGRTDSYNSIQRQTKEARVTYDKTQADLIAFISNNRRDELSRQIAEFETVIEGLSEARNMVVHSVITDVVGTQLEVIRGYLVETTENQLLALQRDQEGRRHLIESYIETLNEARQMVFDEAAQDTLSQLTSDYEELRRVEILLEDARAMHDQVQAGGAGAAASNALALTLLKAEVFSARGELENMIIDASPAALSPEGMIADLDGLVEVLESRRDSLEGNIQTLSEMLLKGEGFPYLDEPLEPSGELADAIQTNYAGLWETGPLTALSAQIRESGMPLQGEALERAEALLQFEGVDDLLGFSVEETPLEKKIQALEEQVRDLKAQLAEEDDRHQELTRARDLAWTTYTSLATKEVELSVATQTAGVAVALAAPAAVPVQDSVSTMRNVGLAAVVGLLLGISAAYLIEFWWTYKGLKPVPITARTVLRGDLPPKDRLPE